MLQPASSGNGSAGLMRLLVGAMLGIASGLLTGVIAALAYRRRISTRGPVPGDLLPSR